MRRNELWTIRDVAQYLRLNRFTVYRMAERGQLPGAKIAQQWRFKPKDLHQWFEQRKRSQRRPGRKRSRSHHRAP